MSFRVKRGARFWCCQARCFRPYVVPEFERARQAPDRPRPGNGGAPARMGDRYATPPAVDAPRRLRRRPPR